MIKQWIRSQSQRLAQAARSLRRQTQLVWLAARDHRTPWLARFIVAVVVAYAVSPIDLIPDFIPVLGVLDDLLLIPLGIALAIRLIPDDVMKEAAEQLDSAPIQASGGRLAAAIIILLWLLAGWWLLSLWREA